MDYKIIESSEANKLAELVKNELDNGYELYGNPGTIIKNQERIHFYFQAVVK